MSRRTVYPRDLTDEEEAILEPLLEREWGDGRGRPGTMACREVMNTFL